MNAVHEHSLAMEPMSDVERERVREQLNRLLETHHFRNSRRYPALLRFIVEETLEGRGEYLKERLLGVKVFDRPADYDTASDPIVRVTIAEIRKRIAQYYHDEAHDAEMRIELLPGRYAPEFRPRSHRREPEEPQAVGLHPLTAVTSLPIPSETYPVIEPATIRRTTRKRWIALSLTAVVLLAAAALLALRWLRPTPYEELWAPLVATQGSVLFCIPTDVGKKTNTSGKIQVIEPPPTGRRTKTGAAAGPTFLDYESLGENVVYSDMLATLRIADVLAVSKRDYHVRLNTSTTLEDLRQGPAVLVGGLDNQWTMRALAPLRFKFAGSDEETYWIADAQNPEHRSWSLDLKQQYGSVTRDYAIIARLHNDQTGQLEFIVAGIGMSGTAAAGELLTDKMRAGELRERIGLGFKKRDFEAVISTDVVNGIAGSAKILEVTVW
jgi:hypothetical protein